MHKIKYYVDKNNFKWYNIITECGNLPQSKNLHVTKEDNMRRKNKGIVTVIIIVGIIIAAIVVSWNSASAKRWRKSLFSNYGGGLPRTVTVYDYNGNIIKVYDGKFDMTESETEVSFDMNDGKRVIIHGGIVISETK